MRSARADVALAVRNFFYTVFLASETANIQSDTLASAEDHLRTIEERYRQGLDSDLVVLRQKVEVANARPALIAARNADELAKVLLKDTLGIDVDAPIRLLGGLEPPKARLLPYDKLQELALGNNPDYQAALQRVQQSDAMVRVAKGLGMPQLSVYADYQWYSESDNAWPGSMARATSSAGGLRLRYPLFTGGDLTERITQARTAYEQAATLSSKIQRSIRVQVKQAWLSAQEAADRAFSQESNIGQARRALEATEVRYREGQSSQLELTDTTLALLQARLLYAVALHDYRSDIAALERAVGAPAEEAVR